MVIRRLNEPGFCQLYHMHNQSYRYLSEKFLESLCSDNMGVGFET
jgi:hypothetical protein